MHVAAFVLALLIAQTAPPVLIDQSGHAFSLASLQGRPVVVTFVSAHCTDACPLVNAQFAQAAQTLARRKIAGRLLTITLDPRHDTPAVMRKLARQFSADPARWLLASGKATDVETVMRRFGVDAPIGTDGYPDAHSTFVYVLDSQGRLTKTMLASTALSDDVVDALHAFDKGAK